MLDKIQPYLPDRPEVTAERKVKYIALLSKHGMPAVVAHMLGLTKAQINAARKADRVFDADCASASELWAEETLVKAALVRAVDGVDEPLMGGKFRDEVVGTKKVYSDSLLALLLKANHDAYRGTGATTQVNQTGGVMILPSAPASVDEWERRSGDGS